MSEDFGGRLARAVDARRSSLVLGLDPDAERVGAGAAAAQRFCESAIDRAGPACVAVKLQLAHFERCGAAGWDAFERVAERAAAAGLLVIADAKRGDIGLTSEAYAAALLAPPIDAMTVNGLFGSDGIAPFVAAAQAGQRGIFVLVRTSNPSAAELQDLVLADGRPWHMALADLVAAWGAPSVGPSGLSAVGAVVGATNPDLLAGLRAAMPSQPFLIPGVGAQGGAPEDLASAFAGRPASALVAVSRAIIFAPDPRAVAEDLRERLWRAAAA